MLQQYEVSNTVDLTCDTTSALTTPFSVKDILNMQGESDFYGGSVKREPYEMHQQYWDGSYLGNGDQYGYYCNEVDSFVNKNYWGYCDNVYGDGGASHIQQLSNMYSHQQQDGQHRPGKDEGCSKVESPSKS